MIIQVHFSEISIYERLIMHFHVAHGIYLTYYNDEIVVLDLIKDRYLILQKEVADILHTALSHQFSSESNQFIPAQKVDLPEDFDETISTLQEMNILDKKSFKTAYHPLPIKKTFSAGMDNIDWRMAYGDLKKQVPKKLIFKALRKRAHVEWLVKRRGFYHLVNAVKKAGKKKKLYHEPTQEEISYLATVLNHACFYFPYKTKCLEWAATLTLLALEKGWKCNLVVGIQNTPFMAHAWVEASGVVVADTQDLPNNLSTILIEPFPADSTEKGQP